MANEKDTKGPITIVVGADPEERMVLIGFNMALNRIELSPEGARDIAKHLLTRADMAEGKIPTNNIAIAPRSDDIEGVPV